MIKSKVFNSCSYIDIELLLDFQIAYLFFVVQTVHSQRQLGPCHGFSPCVPFIGCVGCGERRRSATTIPEGLGGGDAKRMSTNASTNVKKDGKVNILP